MLVSLGIVLALVGGAGWWGVSYLRSLFEDPPDYPGPGHGRVLVQVESGDTLSDVGRTLKSKDVVKSVDAFTAEARTHEDATTLQPGFYALRRKMAAGKALSLLLSPSSRVQDEVTIPEGSRLAEIIDKVAKKSDLTRDDLVSALEHPDEIGLPPYADGHPEGYLFPATYAVDPGTSATVLLRRMVQRFRQAADELNLTGRADALGISPADAVVVASLVEGEARRSQDFGKVARVVYNRLDAGMRLQFDSTVNYALKADKTTVTLQDLQAKSPYNTYKSSGLPPGPIDSPGEKALDAALNPPTGDWLYFVTVDDRGTTKFTSSYQQFLKFKKEAKSGG